MSRPEHTTRRRRAAIGTALLAGVAALSIAPPAFACYHGDHARPAKRPKGGAPLVIGDSVLLGAVEEVARQGIEVDARGCRTMAQGLALLRARRAAHRLPRVVGIALGTNGRVTRRGIGAAMRIVGWRRVLVLVTPRELGGGSGPDAQRMRRAARRHPRRVRLLDWVERSRGHGSWFAPDGIHLGPAGARGMARLLDAMPRMKVATERRERRRG